MSYVQNRPACGKANVKSIGMSHYGNQAAEEWDWWDYVRTNSSLDFTLLPEKQAHSSPIMGVNIIKTDTWVPPGKQQVKIC